LDTSQTPIAPLMFNAVGGSTIHWTGHFPRFRPSDFRVRSLDGVADDWPLSYWDLVPYYDQNDAFVGVSGVAGDPGYPVARPGRSTTTRLARSASSRRAWSSWPATASARHVCCSTRCRAAFPRAWPTAAAWWGAT